LGLSGQDNPNDSGAFDNCRVILQKVLAAAAEEGEEAGVVIEEIHWRQLQIQVVDQFGGTVKLEGGGDWGMEQPIKRTEFDLIRVDADVGCQLGLSATSGTDGISGFIRATRLNGGCTEQTFLPTSLDLILNSWILLWSQNTSVAINWAGLVTWDIEPVATPRADDPEPVSTPRTTQVTWADVPDDELTVFWRDCEAEPSIEDPRCFPLLECEGTPLRFCGAVTTGTPCVTDAQCSAAGTGNESCELTGMLEPTDGFIDMDGVYDNPDFPADPPVPATIPGTEGIQHMCFVTEHLIYLGTSGLNGVDDGCTPGVGDCDDTLVDHNLVQQEIFIQGDARGGRQ
jgi:hypothetical protein